MSEKLDMVSKNIIQENIDYIASKFPNTLKEVMENGKLVKKIDFDVLKQELSNVVIDDKQERYQMTWPDKKKSILLANSRINATLRPDKEKSVDFDNTKNIYIEGDNLDVLKLLRETYLGKIKMIYIDPPYNTGSDFVYEDTFVKDVNSYLEESGQFDDQGNRLFTNNESNGRFHTDWLNMMYPRLKIARDLLTNDGVILISIDENEFYNVINLMNEIFGENNFIENFIWIKNSTKNLSKTTSTNHEYIICYAKSKNELEKVGLFRIKKPGLDEVNNILKSANESKLSFADTEILLNKFFKSHPQLKGISQYNKVDYGAGCDTEQKCYRAYRLSDISAPKSTGKAATYDVVHPITGKLCKTPASGWRFTEQKMKENIKNNLIYFYDDETHVPQFKRYLDTVTTEIVKSTFEDFQEGKKDLLALFNGRCPFDNPKPISVIERFITLLNDGDLVLDFFSGSGTTANAVLDANIKKDICIKYICVQIKEECKEKSEAFNMGYKYITDISEERIRRVGEKIKEEYGEKAKDLDVGFRVLKLDSSNMTDVYYNPKAMNVDLLSQTINNIKPDRTPLDLLFQVMLELGIELSAKIEEKEISNKKCFVVNDNDIVACFDEGITNELVKELAKIKPLYAVFRDSAFVDDSSNINCEQIFKSISPFSTIKVL